MKKAILTSAILALAASGAAYANGGTYMEPASMGHFYIGIGVSRDTAHLDTQYSEVDAAAVLRPFFEYDQSMEGWDGRLFGGYGMTFQDRYYLGLEIFGGITSNDGDFTVYDGVATGINQKFEQQYTYGIRAMPGIKLSDSTMGFFNIGYIRSRFKVSETGAFAASDNLLTNFKENENGIQLGLGMETMVAQNVSLRMGWNWNRYSSISNSVTVAAETEVFRIDNPTTDEFYLDAIYHFV